MNAIRPRLLFLRWVRPGQPGFLLRQLDEHVACLRQFFEVTLVDHDCDYDEVCDRVQPDLAMFESGIYTGPRVVRNPHTHPEVPKVGFLNADAFDPVRATFVSDMAEWGIETFFTVSVSMAEYTPEIADRLFVWPNFVDTGVHHDRRLPRPVPILLTGSQARHYPWRNRVSRVLAQHYPCLTMPHFGWAQSSGTARMPVGEQYARLLGSALVAPTCGTFTRDLVRKHLEIPAARTCLVTERTPALESAGFRDFENCVFADPDVVVGKVEQLLADPDLLARVSDAGHRLVHARHTMAHRRQVRDWYDLFAATGSGDGIGQATPFASLTRDPTTPAGASRPVVRGGGADRRLVDHGWSAVRAGRITSARRSFAAASNLHHLPEAEVGQAWIDLLRGDAAAAESTLGALVPHDRDRHRPLEPDPVQWALHVRVLLCLGRTSEAWSAAGAHPGLHHEELDRLRWALSQVCGRSVATRPAPRRATINPLPETTWRAWRHELATMLQRCGQRTLASTVRQLDSVPDPASTSDGRDEGTGRPADAARQASGEGLVPARPRPVVSAVVGAPRTLARRLVTRAWLDLVGDLAERDHVDRVLLVEASPMSLRQRALRAALSRNPRLPEVVEHHGPPTVGLGDPPTLVYVGRNAPIGADWAERLASARVVLVDGSARSGLAALVDRLTDHDFELLAWTESPGGGFVALRHDLARPVWLDLPMPGPEERPDPSDRFAERGQ